MGVQKLDIKVRKPAAGEERQWVCCPECGCVSFYDYVPFGIGVPIMWLPCGHGVGRNFNDFVNNITEEEVIEFGFNITVVD